MLWAGAHQSIHSIHVALHIQPLDNSLQACQGQQAQEGQQGQADSHCINRIMTRRMGSSAALALPVAPPEASNIPHLPAGGAHEALQHAQRGGLARAVGAQQAEALVAWDGQGQVGHRHLAPDGQVHRVCGRGEVINRGRRPRFAGLYSESYQQIHHACSAA